MTEPTYDDDQLAALVEELEAEEKAKKAPSVEKQAETSSSDTVVMHMEGLEENEGEEIVPRNDHKFSLMDDDFPDVIQFTQSLYDAMQRSGLTPELFCDKALKGDAKEPTQRLHREIKLHMADNHIIAVDGAKPMFADILYDEEGKDGKITKSPWGVIEHVRQISGHNMFELQVANQSSEFTVWKAQKSSAVKTFWLRDFDLGLAPQCKNVTQSDVIATFVTQIPTKPDLKRMYRSWVTDGLYGSQSDFSFSDIVRGLQNSFKQIIDEYPHCPSNFVDGRCQEILEQAAFEVGKITDFKAYLENVTEFERDFAVVANDSQSESWVEEFSAFFIVDEPSYKKLQEREKARRAQLLAHDDQCTVQFLLNVHRNIFDCYLMQLNDGWQQKNITFPQIAAIMWLLFYTQLPVFVHHLLQLLMPTKKEKRANIPANIPTVVQLFQSELMKHLSDFLPIRSRENTKQQNLVDNVRIYLDKIGTGVYKQMVRTLERQTPDCLQE